MIAHISALNEYKHTISLSLSALSLDQTKALLYQELGNSDFSGNLVENVYHFSRGNQFWIVLFAQYIKECGVDVFQSLLQSGIAETVMAASILTRYTATQQIVIKVASVVGTHFSEMLLHDMLPDEIKPALTRILRNFIRTSLIQRSVQDRKLYSFQSATMREAIYQTILPRYVTLFY